MKRISRFVKALRATGDHRVNRVIENVALYAFCFITTPLFGAGVSSAK
jgi:hypothetical protein